MVGKNSSNPMSSPRPNRAVRSRDRSRNRRGATTVEFALVFPIIMAYFIAMITFSQASLLRNTAQHAAYEGARAAIVPGATAEDARNATAPLLATVSARIVNVDVTPEVITDDVASVRVDVNIPLGPNLWIAAPHVVPDDWSVSSSITLRRETGIE